MGTDAQAQATAQILISRVMWGTKLSIPEHQLATEFLIGLSLVLAGDGAAAVSARWCVRN